MAELGTAAHVSPLAICAARPGRNRLRNRQAPALGPRFGPQLVPANRPSPAARLGFQPVSLEVSLGSTPDVNRVSSV